HRAVDAIRPGRPVRVPGRAAPQVPAAPHASRLRTQPGLVPVLVAGDRSARCRKRRTVRTLAGYEECRETRGGQVRTNTSPLMPHPVLGPAQIKNAHERSVPRLQRTLEIRGNSITV